jgi:methylmalonyl-CoA/ethylmalonyl-CoA epimerase
VENITVLPHHFGMSVGDLDEAIDWFARVLGFELDRKEDFLAPHGVHIAFIKNGDFSIELFQHDRGQPASPERSVPNQDICTLGNKHMCFQISSMDEMVKRFEAEKVTVAMGPFEAPGSVAVFVVGPGGALIELLEPR